MTTPRCFPADLAPRSAMYESASHGGCIPCTYAGSIVDLIDETLDNSPDNLWLHWSRNHDGTYDVVCKLDEAPDIDLAGYYWEIKVNCLADA